MMTWYNLQDEERMTKLEEELKDARTQAEDADKKYDEVAKKLAQVKLLHKYWYISFGSSKFRGSAAVLRSIL